MQSNYQLHGEGLTNYDVWQFVLGGSFTEAESPVKSTSAVLISQTKNQHFARTPHLRNREKNDLLPRYRHWHKRHENTLDR